MSGLVEQRELGVGPVEGARVGDDAADGRAVAAHPLGQGVDDDVGAVLDGAQQVGRGEGGVHDERDRWCLLRDLGDGVDVGEVQHRVADRLDEDAAGSAR